MAYSPHSQANAKKEPAGAKKPPVGFLTLIKKLARFLNRTKKTVVTMKVKRDISRLEHERTKEHGELLRQRRFYEGLLRRNNEPQPKHLVADDYEAEIELKESLPLTKAAPKPEPKIPVVNPSPTLVVEKIKLPEIEEAPIYQKPSSQDIFPAAQPAPVIKPVEIRKVEAPVAAPVLESAKSVSEEPLISKVEKPKLDVKPRSENKFLKKILALFSGGSLVKKLAQERKLEEAAKNKNEVESRFWQPYDGVKANLIKDQGVLFFNWQQKMLTLSLSLILCCLAISLVYVGLLIWQKERLNDNKSTIANFEAINIEVTKSEDELKEITAFNKKLDMVSFILNNHVYWTNLLAFLENNTLKDVYYESFTGDLTGKYKLPAVARNLDAVSSQLEVMKAYPMIRTVQYSSSQTVAATKDTPAIIKFSLEMSLDPKIFIK